MTLTRLGSDETLGEVAESVERMKRRRGKPLGYSTGFPALDRPFGGLVPGEVTGLAARPGMGKTALAMNIARNMTRNLASAGMADTHGVAVFSLEMSRTALITREAVGDAGLDAMRFRTGMASDDELERYLAASRAIYPEPLYVDDTGGASIQHIDDALESFVSQKKPVLVVIDHIGIISGSGELYARVTASSNAMKRLAKKYNVPFLVLVQLSRKVEERPNKRPVMSDARDSGAIEQDVDNFILMYRNDYYFPKGHPSHDARLAGITELQIGKARNGESGTVVKLRFVPERTRFESI